MKLLLFTGWALSSVLGLMAQDTPSAHDEPVPTLHVYADLVQMPTLVLSQNRKTIEPRIDERRFSIRVDSGPWFQVTHVRPEGNDPVSLSILLDPSAMDLMPNLSQEIADLVPNFLAPRDHVSLYGLGCGLTRSLDDKPADNARLLDRVDALVKPWMVPRGKEPHCTQQPVYLWDALGFIATQMKGLPGRRVILVLSDGRDKGSVRKWNEVRAYVQVAGIAVFGITMPLRSSSVIVPISSGNDVYPFLSICELSGGILMPTTPELMEATLLRAMAMLRERYILEFPRPSNSTQGVHGVEVRIAGGDKYYVRPTGVTVPLPDDSVLKDPTTVPSDPSRAPEQGNRRVLTRPE
ncbi:hypothetical protein [Edaphobacter modestus]|uniref:VWFA-related protein n=1 Tax=Edaphobacter modestus TaxID=388466 RepID=A0A4Q7YXK4_9BACT|nr:hypothetical protein [Edaphobacter modestus]RZU42490.1 hypothetical protein BDD14_4080 [Edaphobacter modestus]